MRILFEVNHPAHIHFFKNIIWNLEKRGHKVLIVARNKDTTLALLDAYKLKYIVVGPHYDSMLKKAYGLIKTEYKLMKIARNFKPDILVGRGSVYLAYLALFINKPFIAFIDTENANLVAHLAIPFTDVIITPSGFKKKINPKKHVKVKGYKEIAYLHPNYFKPNPDVLEELGLCRKDKFIIVRFVSWNASHDLGQYGFNNKKELIIELEKYGKVFITSEMKISKDFEKYKITISPEKLHDMLYYSTLYIGEGGTTAAEAALLGTPSIFVSTNVQYLGVFQSLQNKYDLIYACSNQEEGLKKAIELLERNYLKEEWEIKKNRVFKENMDLTNFMTDFIENYPASLRISKNQGCDFNKIFG